MELLNILDASPNLESDFTKIRDSQTGTAEFCFYSNKIILRLILKSFDLLPLYEKVSIETPIESCQGSSMLDLVCAVSIMRAGDSMVDVARQLYPGIRIGKILIQRDEATALPALFYCKLCPDIAKRMVLLLDPMLATGGSAIKAIEVLVENGVKEENILFVNLISCPEGLKNLQKTCPKVRIITAFVDRGLNEQKYIVPGLGDFGCRYYGTQE